MELNREQIIKALECCTNIGKGDLVECVCEECPYCIGKDDCRNLDSYALALIKELTEENERWRAEKETLEIYNKYYKYKNKELTAFNRRWAKECAELQDECEYIKADTVRKMQEKLKYTLCINNEENYEFFDYAYTLETIDQVAKEMLDNDST